MISTNGASWFNPVFGGFRSIKESWERFWFCSSAPSQMKLFRSVIGSVMFIAAAFRTPDLGFFYSDQGLVRQSMLSELADMHWRHSLFEIFPGITAVWVCHCILLVALALIVFGIWPRLMAATALVLHISFIHRNFAVAYGVDTITTYYLFYLCFADYRPFSGQLDVRRILGSVAYRLSQVQICLIYAFAGLDKVKGASWWRGDALWMVFANPERSTVDLAWMAHFPALIAFITYLTLFWEVYFPVMVWFRPVGRRIALGIGVLVHGGIALTMGLFSFSSLMISTYLLFLDPDEAEKITQCVKKYSPIRKVFFLSSDQSSV